MGTVRQQDPPSWTKASTPILCLALALVYFAGGAVGLSVATFHKSVSLCWPPTGLALAMVLLCGSRVWPGIFVGAVLVNSFAVWTLWPSSLFIATGNTLEALFGAWLFHRFSISRRLASQRDVVWFLLFIVPALSAVSASTGVLSLIAFGQIAASRTPLTWLIWWLGDAGGALIFAPLALSLVERPVDWREGQSFGLAMVVVALSFVCLPIFAGWFDERLGHHAPSFLALPFVLWAAVRFGVRGAATTSFVVFFAAIVGTVSGRGPFVLASPHASAGLVWFFGSVTAAAGLLLGAAHAQELDAVQALAEEAQRLALALEVGEATAWEWEPDQGIRLGEDWRSREQWSEPVHPAQRATREFLLDQLLAGQAARYSCEHQVEIEGAYRWVHEQGRVVRRDSKGRPALVVGISRDINERRLRELERERHRLQLEQRQRLASLGVLAGGVAHDFNNLLQVIVSSADLLGESGGGKAELDKRVPAILRAAEHASGLCRQLLDYAGMGTMKTEAVALGALLREAAALAKGTLREGVTLEIVPGDESLCPSLDHQRFEQVILNFLINAGEAVGASGRVTLRYGSCETAGAEAGFYVEVEDDGPGMDEETRGRVFDPFFSTKFQGRGLGLAASLGIVQAHDGLVELRSVLGEGACFRAVLPLAPGEGKKSRTVPASRLEGKRLLAVDDHPKALELLLIVLRGQGARVEGFGDPRAALGTFQSSPGDFDAVVIDQTMPDLTGLELLAALRKEAPALPALIVSGFSQLQLPKDELTDFLPKPFSAVELIERIAALLARP